MGNVKGIFILCPCHFSDLITDSDGFCHIFLLPNHNFSF